MRWNRFTISTRTQAEDLIISALDDIGIQGVEIRDHVPLSEEDKARMFVDILEEGPADDGKASLCFYLEEDEDPQDVVERVREVLRELSSFTDIGEGTVEVSQTEDADWINNWKEYFHQFSIDDILIVPSWEEAVPGENTRMIIHMDPGTAFGTGMHETTQLVVRSLKKYCHPGDQVLDVGTGSGILGIVALKLGAGHVLGTDLDPCAASAVEENLGANGISGEDFRMVLGNLIEDPSLAGDEAYDLVLANILPDVLVPLTPVVAGLMKPGGYYITSGILSGKEEAVLSAVREAGLTPVEVTAQGEWVSVTARKE